MIYIQVEKPVRNIFQGQEVALLKGGKQGTCYLANHKLSPFWNVNLAYSELRRAS